MEPEGSARLFLALPCQCGWCYTQMNEADTDRLCERCGRRKVFANGYWTQVTPKEQIKDPMPPRGSK